MNTNEDTILEPTYYIVENNERETPASQHLQEKIRKFMDELGVKENLGSL